MGTGSGIAVVIDSSGYLPRDLRTGLGIEVVPLFVVFPDGRREAEESIDLGDYFDGLSEGGDLPTTAPASIDDFVQVYRPLLAQGKEIVSIHISSALSQTCNNAREAAAALADEGGSRVHVIDSATGAGTHGLLAVAAARRIAAGADVVDVVNTVSQLRAESRLWFAVDNLEYLRRGGRLSGAAAWMGTTLKIKPILTVGSQITAVDRVRTWERALDRMVEFGRKLHESGAEAWFVHYTANKEEADLITERLQETFWRPPEFVIPCGAAIGTHLGPRTIGLGGFPARFLE
jgi:DegV family protein with EDD domain